MHANADVFLTAAIPIFLIDLTQKKSQDVQLELLHHHIKFPPDQMKSVHENEAFGFASC